MKRIFAGDILEYKNIRGEKTHYLVAQVQSKEFKLINLSCGNRWSDDPIETHEENFNRRFIYDYQLPEGFSATNNKACIRGDLESCDEPKVDSQPETSEEVCGLKNCKKDVEYGELELEKTIAWSLAQNPSSMPINKVISNLAKHIIDELIELRIVEEL
jgi:hypothetical protein